MNGFDRAKWGAVGAALPLIVRLSGQQHVYETARGLGVQGVLDIIFPALLSLLAAAIVTSIFRDETNIYKLVVLGISAPALITTWQGYNLAQSAAQNLSNYQQIQNESAPSTSSKPSQASYSQLPLSNLFSVPVVDAAQSSPSQPPVFPHYDPGFSGKVLSSLSGAPPESRDYFVILSASPDLSKAAQQRQSLSSKFSGQSLSIFRTPDNYSPTLYCVVLSPNRSFSEATDLLKKASQVVPAAYIWTFGNSIHPTSPQ